MPGKVAIIGSGAAGLSAAFHLSEHCSLTLFEKNDFFGGHAQTFRVPDGPDKGLSLDVAFMVMNQDKYPNMCRILDRLNNVKRGPSEMSFSYCNRTDGTEYALNFDNAGRKALPSALAPLISEILSFCSRARTAVAENSLNDTLSLEEYLNQLSISEVLRQRYILPMGAALWSAAPGNILQFPAALFLRFLDNHALLNPVAGLSWQHIRGGSQSYVKALINVLPNVKLHTSTPVSQIIRDNQGVTVYTTHGDSERFDAVVIATHSDQALALLGDASQEEGELLKSIRYQTNEAVLHWDDNVMPHNREAWASWNYESESVNFQPRVCISYYLNRLQGHSNAARNYFLTLNRSAPIDENKSLAHFTFEHPLFDSHALQAQKKLAQRGIQNHTCFAGSYLGYGFHEDAMTSGLNAARAILPLLSVR